MHSPFAGSRLALTLRRLRGRFGVAAPKMAVRAHVPWYWRALATVTILAVALALAGWIYDAGRRFAGFDRSESESEIATLTNKNAELEVDVARLRTVASSAESNLKIERATLEQLTGQVKKLEEENTRLKENLAVFENLASGGGKAQPVSISRLRVEPDAVPGRYRYRLLLARRGADAKKDFRGALQFQIDARSASGQNGIIVIPRPEDADAGNFMVSFRTFRSLEGSFQIGAGVRPSRIEARLVQDGAVVASQSVKL